MKTLLTSLALLLAGCANIMYHSPSTSPDPAGMYRGTRECSKLVVEIFTEKPEWHSGCYSEAMNAHCMCLLLSPAILVDWPLEVVADTVTFPYDFCIGVMQ
jgi:uncharacterized protein YceK